MRQYCPPWDGRSSEKVTALFGITITGKYSWQPVFGRTRDTNNPVMRSPALYNDRTVSLKCQEYPQSTTMDKPETMWIGCTRKKNYLQDLKGTTKHR